MSDAITYLTALDAQRIHQDLMEESPNYLLRGLSNTIGPPESPLKPTARADLSPVLCRRC
jgi:hypothetical protein